MAAIIVETPDKPMVPKIRIVKKELQETIERSTRKI